VVRFRRRETTAVSSWFPDCMCGYQQPHIELVLSRMCGLETLGHSRLSWFRAPGRHPVLKPQFDACMGFPQPIVQPEDYDASGANSAWLHATAKVCIDRCLVLLPSLGEREGVAWTGKMDVHELGRKAIG
jgi:hypothetical protein